MSHLDEGTLHALLDGELEVHEVAEIQAHLGACSSCGLRLREVKEFLGEADRLIASVELGAPAMGRAARPEPGRAEAERQVTVSAAASRPEPVAPPQPDSDVRREERARSPEPGRPASAEAPRAGWEPWNEQVPVILVPDNESPAERRRRFTQRFGWAAMVLILIGAGVIGRMSRPMPTRSAAAAPAARADSGAVVSPEETGRPDQAAAQSAETARTALAMKPDPVEKQVARTRAPAPAAAVARPEAKELAGRALGTTRGEARQSADSDTAQASDSSAESDSAGTDTTRSDEAKATDDIATVRRRAGEALAQLDREKRRNQAAAATSALDREKRRRAAQTVQPAAAASVSPPTPPTAEERARVYLRIGLDEASRQLGGPAHVIEGMSPMFMGLAQGVSVPGADATRPVVRVVYQDAQGRLIFLDQQRLKAGQAGPAATPLAWTQGETGIWLHGEVGGEILRTYRPRVR